MYIRISLADEKETKKKRSEGLEGFFAKERVCVFVIICSSLR